LNLPIQGPTDPKDDTFYKEDISDAQETIFRRRECIHDFYEFKEGLFECRHCGERSRLGSTDTANEGLLIKLTALPTAPTRVIRRKDLPKCILDHYDRWKDR
jgi:hypothetical protein